MAQTALNGRQARALQIADFSNQFVQSTAVTSTTLNTFQPKASLTFTPTAGTYLIQYASEVSAVANTTVDVRVTVDGVEAADSQFPITTFVGVSGMVSTALTAGSHTIAIQFRSTVAGKSVSIRRAVLLILRQF